MANHLEDFVTLAGIFLLGSIHNLPGLKFYLLYCEQGKTRPHDRTASELGEQGIFFPSMLQTRKTRNFFS